MVSEFMFGSTSQQDPGTPHRSSTVGCQTDRTQTVSVGTLQRAETRSVGTQTVELKVSVATQLSSGTLKSAHVRSKGIQATVSFKNVGTKTSTYPEFTLASTPIKGPGLGPSKRPRLELEQEQGETLIEFEETLDSSYHPDDNVEESDVSLQTRSTHSDAKYIVFESCLGQLFEKFPICRAMQLEIFQYETFRRHARHYLEPAIIHKWKTDQLKIFQQLHHHGGKVTVAGDMRADSPGHSAKFGSYTLMHLGSNTIVDFQLVQSNEVGGSYHMEGLKRCLDHLESNDLAVEYIVTDRHPQIQKFLRERNMEQFYDVWHFEKAVQAKIPCRSVGVETLPLEVPVPFLTSTPLKRPPKRPCVDLEEDYQDPFEGSSSLVISEGQDATYDPAESITNATETTSNEVGGSYHMELEGLKRSPGVVKGTWCDSGLYCHGQTSANSEIPKGKQHLPIL
ncbi:hypothetical protein JOQ06_010571 [Pogonophryne albipinna]|uniref:Uncharacterized protein n=1 Tax=Pogonophryne albipinna TaxID=1090488 RepID=A0AAD6AWF0_9TELE|nr:hypothetical protein JOQ06_010571 [Pogonophryne albipinna]